MKIRLAADLIGKECTAEINGTVYRVTVHELQGSLTKERQQELPMLRLALQGALKSVNGEDVEPIRGALPVIEYTEPPVITQAFVQTPAVMIGWCKDLPESATLEIQGESIVAYAQNGDYLGAIETEYDDDKS